MKCHILVQEGIKAKELKCIDDFKNKPISPKILTKTRINASLFKWRAMVLLQNCHMAVFRLWISTFLQNPLMEDNEIMKNKEDVHVGTFQFKIAGAISTKLGTLIFCPFELRCCYNLDYCKELRFIWAMWPAGFFIFYFMIFFGGGGQLASIFIS